MVGRRGEAPLLPLHPAQVIGIENPCGLVSGWSPSYASAFVDMTLRLILTIPPKSLARREREVNFETVDREYNCDYDSRTSRDCRKIAV